MRPVRERFRNRQDALVASDAFVQYKQDAAADELVAFDVSRKPGDGAYALGPGRPAPVFALEILSERTWR